MLIIRNLSKSYWSPAGADSDARDHEGRRTLLNGVNLEVGAGEFVAITGESGTGKSTFLNIIAGLEPIDEGLVEVDGRNMGALDDAARARLRRQSLGFVFQAFHLLPYLTVEENVAVPLRLLGGRSRLEMGAAVGEMLAALGLADLRETMPQTLSGGEAQRVAIARALVHRPRLILADEPTGNLDADNSARVIAMLKEQAQARHAAVLLVTHSIQAAARADRVLVLADRTLTVRAR